MICTPVILADRFPPSTYDTPTSTRHVIIARAEFRDRRHVLAPAYREAGWRDARGSSTWTWHSLRHVFCTTALFTWRLDAADVSRMAGHANYRTTLDMYVGATAGVLDRARRATQ